MNLEEPLAVRLEMDEMWGRVYCKETPCWLWHAINHENGNIIAYVLRSREHGMLQQLLELLNGLNLNIVAVYSDNNFSYHDIISPEILQTGKKNIQKIERKHLSFRTRLKRLARKTICFSKSLHMHKIMIRLLLMCLNLVAHFFRSQPSFALYS